MIATTKQIIETVAREFANGQHQGQPNDLPFELQYRLECSWGKALTYANRIRVEIAEYKTYRIESNLGICRALE